MKTIVHLLAMPWKSPFVPSIQLGCLKAYLDREFKHNANVRTHAYSAFLDIAHNTYARSNAEDIATALEELPYFLLLMRRFNPLGLRNIHARCNRYVKRYPDLLSLGSDGKTDAEETLRLLETNTVDYLERELVPRFEGGAMNVVGFSLCLFQTCSSLYAYYYLQKKYGGSLKLLFLFGGGALGLGYIVETLRQYRPKAYAVVGEGESRLRRIVELSLKLSVSSASFIVFKKKLASLGGDVVDLGGASRQKKTCGDTDGYGKQLPDLGGLPAPDYDEFFQLLSSTYSNKRNFDRLVKSGKIMLPLEGSRGCVHHCDFCGLNPQWRHYRRRLPETIRDHVTDLSRKYGCKKIEFVDNNCDPWASGFASTPIRHADRYYLVGEFRTRHDEFFWTRLVLAGFKWIQVGCEALSDPLLTRMNKGTTVLDNLRAMKYCTELHVNVFSNLILYHPKTTLSDVRETQRVLSCIPHFGRIHLGTYELAENSPLFEGLSGAQRRRISRDNTFQLSPQLLSVYPTALQLPRSLCLSRETIAALKRLQSGYCEVSAERIYLSILSQNKVRITLFDNRSGTGLIHTLEGAEVSIYDACHRGLTLGQIVECAKVDEKIARRVLRELVKKKLMICVGQHYLSLALRPRRTLITNYRRHCESQEQR